MDGGNYAPSGDKQRARDLLAAIRTLKTLEAENRPATPHEREALGRFGGFGAVALQVFPDPVTGQFKPGWEGIGRELEELLTPEELASARRTTFNAFYTSPLVMSAIYHALDRFGVPHDARALEPGCGPARFISAAPDTMRFTGVELDSLSGRIARAIHPEADIRIENFRDTRLPPGIEAVVGNVPFADITLDHDGHRFSLHDYFFAKSLDALEPGGVMGLVTSRYSLDKGNGAARDFLADRADLLGAIRLPNEAFKDQGTSVVTDIVFLRKRHPGEVEADPSWRGTAPLTLDDGREVTVNAWLAAHPEMILGELALDRGQYNAETLKVRGGEDYPHRLLHAVRSLPEGVFSAARRNAVTADLRFTAIPYGLGEGSFFVGPDKALMQVECGEAVPVCHGTRPLSATEGLMGRRLAALIHLRDDARRVLASQNEGWPVEARDDARRDLNRTYSAFVAQFGPINKTTFSVNAQGNEVRRMPNVVKFREDPDAFLVMSLEDYDEATGKAERAPIMRQDVVGRTEPVGKVASAEEGLLVSLNERGRVDLDHIASLYDKPQGDILAELGELVFHDPETDTYVTRDAYLSGNVRRKLEVARASSDPRHARNVAPLEAVQPEDLLPGDIDANLGAPWLPTDVIRDFAADLLSVPPSEITVAHLPRDAVWSVDGTYAAGSSVASTSEFGTGRIDALSLLDQALNMKSPTIYDVYRDSEGEKRVVNQAETIAAREKQKRIKQRFSTWVFADPERAEMLVRLYNDTFNNLRLQEFDGAHLTFPGMNPAVTLRPHQKAAVWRIISDGNTLLAHAVGAGKTNVCCASAMKLKQAGLVRTSVITCPNHMLEQFGREFLHLYPNGRILVAGKEDLARDRRKLLTAKIATGNWDAIILTHSSFERIGMSPDFQRRFLQGQIDDYGALLVDARATEEETGSRAHRNMLKTIEKRKAAFEEKLKELAAETKKDRGLVFDDLGVGQLFVDECFTYDTVIETDAGPLKIGDVVSGRLPVRVASKDPVTGAVEWKPVVRWLENKRKGKLVEVFHEHGSFICTPEHKVWLDGIGYKQAGTLQAGEGLLLLQEGLYSELHRAEQDPGKILLGGVQGPSENAIGSMRTLWGDLQVSLSGRGQPEEEATPLLQRAVQNDRSARRPSVKREVPGLAQGALGDSRPPVERPIQPNSSELVGYRFSRAASSGKGEVGAGNPGYGTQAEGAGREWPHHRATSSAGPAYRPSDGTADQHEAHQALHGEAAQLLQSRLGGHRAQAGSGSGRGVASDSSGQGSGREEGQGPVSSRVVGVEVLEPGSDGEYRFGGRAHSVVYDIEVADNHNYFANGVLVSNCHYFKNLETPTKMDRVSGIQTQGSQRAFDLLMKTRYLQEQTPGRGFVGATGTPISNSMVELYTMSRLAAPDMLRERGIDHFDAWAASHGEVIDVMEISPDGKSLRPNSRFAKFVNLPELQQMFRSFADVQTADMLKLPVPALKGGKATVVACPMSDEQKVIQDGLVERYERIRRGGVDPRDDNALAITTDGRKLALDARLIDPDARDDPDSKLNAMVENVAEVWRRTGTTLGTQMIFCDFGVNANAWGFSVYGEIKDKLAAAGIPREQVADIGDADTDAKKAVLFEKVRAGKVRVLIGSTAKMGTGTNVQKRLVALHHLDAPWKPAEVEQRDGRILRQGNSNAEVEICRYVTEGSFDAFMWQCLERKARFIAQVMTGKSGVRRADDIGGAELSFAEVKAIASGNPAVLTLAEIEADIQRLALLKRSHADDQYRARLQVKHLPADIDRLEHRADALDADYALATQDHPTIEVGGRAYGSREKAIEAMNDLLKLHLARAGDETQAFPLGRYRGLELTTRVRRGSPSELQVSGAGTRFLDFRNVAAGSLLNRIDDRIEAMPQHAAGDREERRLKIGQLAAFEDRVGQPFDQEDKLDQLQYLRNMLETALSGEKKEGEGRPTDELVAEYQALKADAPVMPPPPAPVVVEEEERPTAVILPFPAPVRVIEHETPPPPMLPAALEAPRPVVTKAPPPIHQGTLLDPPAHKRAGRAGSFREAVRREGPHQLSLF